MGRFPKAAYKKSLCNNRGIRTTIPIIINKKTRLVKAPVTIVLEPVNIAAGPALIMAKDLAFAAAQIAIIPFEPVISLVQVTLLLM